ncbi:MAG TPA: hypothetical protein VN283_01380 [Thiobacillus sp.]|nr:hypothetical protein [Thiobacillus sp.]
MTASPSLACLEFSSMIRSPVDQAWQQDGLFIQRIQNPVFSVIEKGYGYHIKVL